MKNIVIINGPNLNLLGTREPEIYGNESFESFLSKLKEEFPDVELQYFQSNVEGELIDALQEYSQTVEGIILNPAAYTHTSIAIADTISSIDVAVIEVHISHVFAREEFRKESKVAPYCLGSITGLGLNGYRLALEHFIKEV